MKASSRFNSITSIARGAERLGQAAVLLAVAHHDQFPLAADLPAR